MKMNAIEKMLVNNPVRSLMLRAMAHTLLRRAGTSLANKTVLEIGCGQGAGTALLRDQCGAARVVAFDYDTTQVARAKRRHAAANESNAALFVGDVARLPFPDSHFDAVVEFAILHHVPEWRMGLREIARVLKPGGVLLYEEYLRGFTGNPVAKLFLLHPEEGMFTSEMFYRELASAGLSRSAAQPRLGQWWLAGLAVRSA